MEHTVTNEAVKQMIIGLYLIGEYESLLKSFVGGNFNGRPTKFNRRLGSLAHDVVRVMSEESEERLEMLEIGRHGGR